MFICTLRLAADNCYEVAYRAIQSQQVYAPIRFIEAASVLNPSSIVIAQAEKMIIPVASPGKRIVFYHPNDFDALIIMTDELRSRGLVKEARKYLFKSGRAAPYNSLNKIEMGLLFK